LKNMSQERSYRSITYFLSWKNYGICFISMDQ